jgi:hypothetical protein
MKKPLAIALFVVIFSLMLGGPSGAKIAEVDWLYLSDRDITPTGKAALSIDRELWRHAETEHFIYHFTNAKEAETVYIHAEVYYKWIKDLFGIKEDTWKKKCHIYIFTDEESWRLFKKKAGADAEGDACTTGWELFIFRRPYWLSPRQSLAHEVTHIILFRFLDGPAPLALDEGFSEFLSYRALAMQLERGEYDIRTVELLEKKDYIPLKELLGMRSYPPEEKLAAFYREGELLVRFLALTYGGDRFYKMLRDIARGDGLNESIEASYGMDLGALEEKFKDFSIKGEKARRAQ